ncbi:hypothetical protein CRE_19126 [Caenorhabditis remanei]|uniref:CHK kinase-like domain-containing protein n=1 Tax=Caenorhabditis remanei TaxID=31234 RepID=E3MJG3_CAERE|nr:hypothetical protein CRE_19126 [Caenorhabditis remanei]
MYSNFCSSIVPLPFRYEKIISLYMFRTAHSVQKPHHSSVPIPIFSKSTYYNSIGHEHSLARRILSTYWPIPDAVVLYKMYVISRHSIILVVLVIIDCLLTFYTCTFELVPQDFKILNLSVKFSETMSDLIIDNVPLTKEWLADVVEKKIGVKPTIGTINLILQSGILDNSELGYMSMIRKVELHFNAEQEENHPNLPKHVVLKIACSAKGSGVIENAGGEASSSEDAAAVEQFMHNTECDYYQVFAKLTEKPLKVPTIYAAVKAGEKEAPVPVIVMEMFEDCKVYDLITGFNEEQLYKIVDELVKLHIFSLTTEKWKEVERDPTMIAMADMFGMMVKGIADNLAKQPGLEIISTFVRNTFEKDPKFLQTIGDEYLEESGFCCSINFSFFQYIKFSERTSVMTHGDLWAPQILWDKEDNIAGIIDWQITHRGSPMEDLHHVLSTCTSVENRQKLTKPLLDYYFDKLSTALDARGVKMPWTREEIDEEYKHCYIPGAALTIFANGFWANSPVLQTDGKPDIARIGESFARCKSYIEEVVKEHNMS